MSIRTVRPEEFASWLSAALRRTGLTARSLSRMAGVSHTTVLRLASGETLPTLATAQRLVTILEAPTRRRRYPGAPLTATERQVMYRLCRGMTDAQIAEDMGVGRKAVNGHVSNILLKLDVPTRAGAAARFTAHRLGHDPAVSTATLDAWDAA